MAGDFVSRDHEWSGAVALAELAPATTSPPRLAVRSDGGGDVLERLEPEWNALLARSPHPQPFLRHEWVSAWWAAFGGNGRLAVIECRDADTSELLGVLPLYAPARRTPLAPRVLRLLGDERAGSTGLGAFERSDIEGPVMDALLECLVEHSGTYDVLDLRMLDPNTAFFTRCLRLAHGPSDVRFTDRTCFQIALPPTWDAYLSESLGQRSRAGVRRSRRKAEQLGAVFGMVTDAAELPDALADLVRLVEGRMRSVIGGGFTLSYESRGFLARAFDRLLAEDRLRLGYLAVDCRRVAMEYQFRDGDTIYAIQGGFDMDYAAQEVYKALFSQMIESAIAEGCRVLDFGWGSQDYKRMWGVTGERRLCDVRLYRDSTLARFRRAGDGAVERVSRALENAPPRVAEPLARVARAAVGKAPGPARPWARRRDGRAGVARTYPRGLHVTVIEDEDAFADLQREWNEGLAASRQERPFLRHEWLYEWWRSFGDGATLKVLECRDGSGGFVGGLPLYCRRGKGPVGPRVLRVLGDELAGSTGLGAFARADLEDTVMDALAEQLRRMRAEYDVLDLRMLDPGGPFFERCARLGVGPARVHGDERVCLQVALPDDFDTYMDTALVRSARHNVRKSLRRTTEIGGQVERVTDPSEIPQALEDYVRLFEGRMRTVVDPRFAASEAYRAFIGRMMERLLADGRLRLAFLTVKGRRVAVEYELRYADTVYSLSGGFDVEFGQTRVFKALFARTIESAIAEGCRVLDFGWGDQEYKRRWGVSDERRFSDLRVYRRSFRGMLVHSADLTVAGGARLVALAPPALADPLERFGHSALSRLRGVRGRGRGPVRSDVVEPTDLA